MIEVLLLGILAAGLVCTGYWLRSADFHRADLADRTVRARRDGRRRLTGGLLLGLFPPRPFGVQSLFFLLVSAATEGALIGFLLGRVATSEPATRIESVHELRDAPADPPDVHSIADATAEAE